MEQASEPTPVFSMGIDTRTREQKSQKKKQKRRHRLHKHSNNPVNYSFSFDKNSTFSFIPDIPKKYEILLMCILSYNTKSLDSIDTFFPPNNVWCSEKRNARKWLEINFKRKWAFRTLYNHYLYYKMRGRVMNTIDPSTLCPIKKCVLIADIKQKGYYQFEAKSIQRQFDSVIGYNEWLFPEPGDLKNPLTNQKFTYGQLLEIIRQLRIFQCTSWLIEAYLSTKFQNNRMKAHFNTPLYIHGIDEIVRNPSSETALDLMRDFMYEEFVANSATVKKRRLIKPLVWAVENISSDPYIQEWLEYFKQRKIYDALTVDGNGCQLEEQRLDFKGVTLFIDTEAQKRICFLWSQNRNA
jgi:hypothetical protein